MVRLWWALRRARGCEALAGLRARPDKFGGVSVDLAELRRPLRLERAAFGRWLRGKCRAGAPGAAGRAGGVGGASAREGAPLSRLRCAGRAAAVAFHGHRATAAWGRRQEGAKIRFPVPCGRP